MRSRLRGSHESDVSTSRVGADDVGPWRAEVNGVRPPVGGFRTRGAKKVELSRIRDRSDVRDVVVRRINVNQMFVGAIGSVASDKQKTCVVCPLCRDSSGGRGPTT